MLVLGLNDRLAVVICHHVHPPSQPQGGNGRITFLKQRMPGLCDSQSVLLAAYCNDLISRYSCPGLQTNSSPYLIYSVFNNLSTQLLKALKVGRANGTTQFKRRIRTKPRRVPLCRPRVRLGQVRSGQVMSDQVRAG